MLKDKVYNLKEQTAFLFAGKIFGLAFQILTPIFLVRIFGKEDYGFYQNINLIISFTAALISWNLSTSLYYFYNISEDKSQLLSQSLLIQLVISLGFSLIFIISGPQYLDFFQIHSDFRLQLLIGVSIILFINGDFFESLLIVEKKSKTILIYLLFSGFYRFACICTIALIFRDVYFALLALFSFFALQTFVMFIYIFKKYRISFKEISKVKLLEQLKYIFPLGLSKIIGEIGNKADKLIFAHFFSKQDYALYSVASFRIPFVNLIFPSVSNVIIPQISLMANEKNYDGARLLWHKMINIFSIITIPFLVFSFFTAKELIVLLFTDQYIEAIPIYQIVLLTFLIQIFARGTIITAFGKTSYFLKIQMVSTFAGIIMGILFIKRFGMLGAAITYVLTFYLNGMLQVYASRIILGVSFKDWLPWRSLFVISSLSLFAAIIIIPVKLFIGSNFLILLCSFILYLLFVVILFHIFKQVDVKDVTKMLITKYIKRRKEYE